MFRMDVGEIINNQILPHWPFAAWVVISMVIGQVMSKNVFTKTAHYTQKPVWFWWWGRKTLPLHPIAAGLVMGLIWRNPENGVDTLVESCAYFALAGALSVWGYETLKGFAKEKGIDIDLPGVDESVPPSPPQA